MKRTSLHWLFVTLTLPLVAAEPASSDRVAVPFSDASRPGLLKANLINGGITVRAYDGKEVVITGRAREAQSGRESARQQGLRRIPMTSSGLEVVEENNEMSVSVPHGRSVDLEIQVPVRTSLKLRTINDGGIRVEGVQGEIEVNDTNGSVTLTGISGSVVAHALNGNLTASLVQVDAQKAMSFSSMNGTIDVTLPADLKASVKLKTNNGEAYSDFDITTQAAPAPVVEDSKSQKGKYRVRIDRTVYGTINGGGAEIQFSNFNGSIYIRKGK